MKTPKCSICNQWVRGYLERWPTIWICGNCRTLALRAMHHFGVTMTAENPLIDDLCKDSHALEKAAYSFTYQKPNGDWHTFYIQPPNLLAPKPGADDSDNYFEEPLDLI